jgi:hypothetical protein
VIADKSGLDSPLTFSLVNKSLKKLTTSLKYKFIDNKSVQINKGIGNIDLEILPDKFKLFQNYPNPFNGETVIKYELPKSGKVKIKIYDLVGKEVFSESYYNQKPGIKKFTWNGKDNRKNVVSSGVYFFQISTGENIKRMKMILLK